MFDSLDKKSPEFQKFEKELEELVKLKVYAGFNQKSGSYQDSGVSIVEIAAMNEFGTSRIPARPFLEQTLEVHKEEFEEMMGEEVNQVMNGKSAKDALNTIGVFAKGKIQYQIRYGDYVPNAPITVLRKGSDQPLIDTGLMRQRVEYEVK